MREVISKGWVGLIAVWAGCAITSPYWGYVPASVSAPIPFQAWAISTGPLYVECADDTGGHGNPSEGEASYVPVTTMYPSTSPSLDSAGSAIYSASASVALPSVCWKYFGAYGFWQANVRVVTINSSGGKVPLTSYDLAGLSCLGREVGKVGRWNGHVNKGCEKKFLGTSDAIPYVVLRIEGGYEAGLRGASKVTAMRAPEAADVLPAGAKPVTAVPKLPAGELPKQLR